MMQWHLSLLSLLLMALLSYQTSASQSGKGRNVEHSPRGQTIPVKSTEKFCGDAEGNTKQVDYEWARHANQRDEARDKSVEYLSRAFKTDVTDAQRDNLMAKAMFESKEEKRLNNQVIGARKEWMGGL